MATPFMISLLSSKSPPPSTLLFLPHSIPIFSTKNPTQNLQHKSSKTSFTISFSSSSSKNGRTPSPLEAGCPVPFDQQPINEYQNLCNSFPYSWASSSDLVQYYARLIVTGLAFALFVGLPVAWFGVVNPQLQPFRCALGALSSGLFVVTLAVLHIYLGWVYVGNRLLSATVEYEETGWYDGQIWVKTAEVLARDRLLGSFLVKPVLNRLKFTLVGLAAILFTSVLFLTNVAGSYDVYFSPEENGGRAVPGVYNDESARSFEPDAFCGEPGQQ